MGGNGADHVHKEERTPVPAPADRSQRTETPARPAFQLHPHYNLEVVLERDVSNVECLGSREKRLWQTPRERRAILARVCQAILVSAACFDAAVDLISGLWPVTQPYGWTLLPWVILAVCGVGYAFTTASSITR